MKKIMALLVSVVYVFAIVFVAVLGVIAEVQNKVVDVEKIVLVQARNLPQGGLLTYPEDQGLSRCVYALYSRPDESTTSIPEGGQDISWNVGGLRFDYVLQIRNFKAIYDGINWKDEKGKFDVSAFVLPENATKQELNYSLLDGSSLPPTSASVSSNGVITFNEKLTDAYAVYLLTVSATDNSSVTCNIRIIAAGYSD